MIVDKLMERAHAIGGLVDAEISQIDYEIDGDDTVRLSVARGRLQQRKSDHCIGAHR